GNSGTTPMTFTVTVTPVNTTKDITVNYATIDGTATALSDYQPTSGTLKIQHGHATGTITVLVKGDTVFEGDENFFVNLSNPHNAVILQGQGVGTIHDD